METIIENYGPGNSAASPFAAAGILGMDVHGYGEKR
jgi:hypothetical protein